MSRRVTVDHMLARVSQFLDYCLGGKNWSVTWENELHVTTFTVNTGGRLTDDIIPDLEQISYDTVPAYVLTRWIIK